MKENVSGCFFSEHSVGPGAMETWLTLQNIVDLNLL